MEITKGFEYAYGWNSYYQKILGFCSMKDEGLIAEQRAWALILLIFVTIWLPSAATLPILWGDLNSSIDCLSTNMPIAVSMAKMIVLQCHRKVTGSILVKIVEDWTSVETKEEYKTMLDIARISRFISILSVSLTNVMFVAYIAARLWLLVQKTDDGMDPRLAIGLLHDSYFPFNTTKLTIFVPLWISQFFGSFLVIMSYAGSDCLVSMMVLHLCGQLRIVRHSLKGLQSETTIRKSVKYWRNITDIVERHEQLNRLAFTIKDTFSSILLVQMLACSVTFCLQYYTMFITLVDRNDGPFPLLDMVSSVFYAGYTMVHLFIYCYVGDRLLVESTSLADDFYESAWYNWEPKEAKAFLFICHRSRIPLEVKAGKFCTFNLQLFNNVMKTSMGYLSMLMAIKDRLME